MGGACRMFERWRGAYRVLVGKPEETKPLQITVEDGTFCIKVNLIEN